MDDQAKSGRGKKKKSKNNYGPQNRQAFDYDELELKATRKGRGKTRVSWKNKKVELEHMDIEDLKEYILETEY